MFETEPILFLQSFATDLLTAFMAGVSAMGLVRFYIVAVSLVLFGVSFRKGFLLLQLLLWTGLLTSLLKALIALPRPVDVDRAVRALGEGEVYRSSPGTDFGLPSGHVSGAAALWGGVAVLFRKRGLWIAPVVFIPLMALSRMYLGRHFLADVLAGALLGILMVLALRLAIRGERGIFAGRLEPATFGERVATSRPARWRWTLALLGSPLILLLVFPQMEAREVGRLFGINAGFLAVAWRGLPRDEGSLLRRAGRVALGILVYLAADAVLDRLVTSQSGGVLFFETTVESFLILWGTVEAALKLRLYVRRDVKV